MIRDLRYGARSLLRTPGATAVAVLSLALGIGSTTTTFSWIDGLLLRPISGAADGDRLVSLLTVRASGESILSSYPNYRDYRDRAKLLEGLTAGTGQALSLGSGRQAEPVWAELVAGNFFEVLRVRPLLGRGFRPAERGDQPGASPLAVISHGLWKSRFAADPAIIGKKIILNRLPFTVIGVAPADFHGAFVGVDWDLWLPIGMTGALEGTDNKWLESRSSVGLQIFGRLRPGVSLEQARGEIQAISRELAGAYPEVLGQHATLVPLWKAPYTAPSILGLLIRVLMGVSVVVLLIVWANIMNLLLARATTRQREFGVRVALGAGRVQVIRQLLAESLLLAGAGGGLGILLAAWMAGSLLSMTPATYFKLWVPASLNVRVLSFTAAVSAIAAVLLGIAPALQAMRCDAVAALKAGARGASAGRAPRRLRRLLVTAQVALALVALAGAGLFLRSFRAARATHPGFDARRVLLVNFDLSTSGYDRAAAAAFRRALQQRLEGVPGVRATTLAEWAPLGFEGPMRRRVAVEGYTPGATENMALLFNIVSPGYFELMRVPLVMGRDFAPRDDERAPPVAIVNQAFADRFFQGRHPLGRRIQRGDRLVTVVGVVANSKAERVDERPQPFLYLPFDQFYEPDDQFKLHVRTDGRPETALPAVRDTVRAIDPGVALFGAVTMEQHVSAALLMHKTAATMLSSLGAIAVLLAALGLYAVMAYSVSRRTQEIGIRVAVGATPGAVLRTVMAEAGALTLAGVAAGLLAVWALGRMVGGLLYRVSPTDPLVLIGATLLLFAIALAASYLPARRALDLSPVIALREE